MRGDSRSDGVRYRSQFDNWERRASVRTKPRRTLDADGPIDTYFPPELAPAALHPLVVSRGPAAVRRFLVHALFQYLHFTTELESTAVIPVSIRLGRGACGLDLPREMRRDAYKITTDEAWHAQ